MDDSVFTWRPEAMSFRLHHSFCGSRKQAAEVPYTCKELLLAGSEWRTGLSLVHSEYLGAS